MDPKTLSYVIPILVILPIVYLRISRAAKPQRLKLGQLWVRPAIMIFAAGSLMAASPPQPSDYVWFVLAGAAGAASGWYWGKLTHIELHPEDGTLMSKGSQAGVIVLVLLILFRLGMRAGIQMEAQEMHLNAALLTDVLIVFTALLFSVQGLEIYLRAQRLMKQQA